MVSHTALLRASGQNDSRDYALDGLMDGTTATGVPGGAALVALVDAALGGDEAVLVQARGAVRASLGLAALIDATAVIGAFNGITRIADATGIPLEPAKAEQTADFFAALGIGRFRAAKI
jgi:alkylhydroperoxidase family enzyme